MRMRKSFVIAVSLATLVALSCAKEEPHLSRVYALEASMPSDAQTRTALGPKSGEAYPVFWSEGDVITVNGVRSKPLTSSQAGGRTASFNFPGGVLAPFRIEYGNGIPSSQEYLSDNVCSGYMTMAAESSGTSFTMKHQSCIVAFTLTGSVSVAGLSLRSLDGSPVSSVADCVQMTVPSGGVSLSGGKTFRFVVAPGTHAKGLSLDVYTNDGSCMNLTAFVGKRLAAGRIYELGSVEFAANVEPVIAIASRSDLLAFAARVAAGEKALRARLVADIDLSAGWTPLEGFTGELDGGGHRVTGLKRAFVQELTGCVRNLTVQGNVSIGSASDIAGDESKYWAGILANRVYTGGLIDNCVSEGSLSYSQWGKSVAAAGIAGYASRGTIKCSVNRASVSVTGDGSAVVYAGGIVGYTYASSDVVSVKGCRNEGSVSLLGNIKSASAGGIAGNMGTVHTSVIEGCVNVGSVTVEASAKVLGNINLGGIAGSSQNDMSACSNEGSIHQAASTSHIQNIGGIAGSVVTGRVDSCSNGGSILLDGSPSTGVIRCGGILGFATGDSSVDTIALADCSFSGGIMVDIAAHSAIYAKPVTGLYSIANYSETGCVSTGTVTQR